MLNKEIFSLFDGLNELGGLKGVKLAYAIAKNVSVLTPEIEAFKKSLEPTKEFSDYEKTRIEILEKYAKKDDDGKPIIEGNEYVLENKDEALKEIASHSENHKDVIEARQKQIGEFNDLMDKENAVSLHKVSLKDIPEDVTTKQMVTLLKIIED